MSNTKFKNTISVLIAIVNVLALIGVFLYIAIAIPTFGSWFYKWQFSAHNSAESLGVSSEQLGAIVNHVIRYLIGIEDNLQIQFEVDGYIVNFFSQIELDHMADVQNLFRIGFVIASICAAVFLITLLLHASFGKNSIRYMCKAWFHGALSVVITIAVLSVFVFIWWDDAFRIFHELLFDNQNWLLDPDNSLLIQLLPSEFFMSIAAIIGGIFVGLLLLLIAFSGLLLVKQRKKIKFVNDTATQA